MTIYNYIELLFFVLFFVELSGTHTQARKMMFFRIEIFIIFFILAFRNFNVGSDTPIYVWHFIQSSKYPYESQSFGYELFCTILRFIFKDWRFFLFITSLISIIPFGYYVKKYASFVTLPFMTFLLCWKQLWLLETPIKQEIAITLFFCGTLLLYNESKKQKTIKKIGGIGLCILSVLTHSTMIIAAPFALVFPFVKFSKTTAMICIIISMLFSSYMVLYLPQLFDSFMQYAYTYELFENIGNYQDTFNVGLETLNINAILPQSLYVILLVSMCSEEDLQKVPAKCLILAIVFHNIFVSFPNNPRIILYFSLIGSALCPSNFNMIIKQKNNQIMANCLILLMGAFLYLHYKTCSTFVPTHSWDFLPYNFWFLDSVEP